MEYKLFSAGWCINCKPVKKALEELKLESGLEYEVIDVDEDPEYTGKMGVRGIPQLLLVSDGKVIKSLVGSKNKQQIQEFLEE